MTLRKPQALSKFLKNKHQTAMNKEEHNNEIYSYSEDKEFSLGVHLGTTYLKNIKGGFYDLKEQNKIVKSTEMIATLKTHGVNLKEEVLREMIRNLVDDCSIRTVFGEGYKPDVDDTSYLSDTNKFMLNSYIPEIVDLERGTDEQRAIIDNYFTTYFAPKERKLLTQWLAQAALNPGKRNEFGLMLFGKSMGTGKGTIITALENILGKHNSSTIEDANLWVKSPFNSEVKDSCLTVLDEVYTNSSQFANKMKRLITENTLAVTEKGKDPVKCTNYTNTLVTSNDLVPFTLPSGDRRWMCINIEFPNMSEDGLHDDNIVHGKLAIEFNRLINSKEGLSVFKQWLSEVSLSDWNRHQCPMTDAKLALQGKSVSNTREQFTNIVEKVCQAGYTVINIEKLFNRDNNNEKVSRDKRYEWLEEEGFKFPKLDSTGKARVFGKNRLTGWVITPLGAEQGGDNGATGKMLTELATGTPLDQEMNSPLDTTI